MLLVAIREDGSKVRIQVGEGARIGSGIKLDRIDCLDGVCHYFTKDGHYDGWEVDGSFLPDAATQEALVEHVTDLNVRIVQELDT